MKIRLLKSHLKYEIGKELEVNNTAGKYLIDQGIAESISKSLDSPPKDKMIRQEDIKTKINLSRRDDIGLLEIPKVRRKINISKK